MKIKKIAAMCKRKKRVIIYERKTGSGTVQQYIGDESAAYPVYGIPRMSKENLMTIFDIPVNEWETWFVSVYEMPEELNAMDTDSGERLTVSSWWPVTYGGKVLIPMGTRSGGIVFLEESYLDPLSDCKGGVECYERKDDRGKIYIAVKSGLYLQAIITPVDLLSEDFVSIAQDFGCRCEKELKDKTALLDGIVRKKDK